jgi:hypothetical protein
VRSSYSSIQCHWQLDGAAAAAAAAALHIKQPTAPAAVATRLPSAWIRKGQRCVCRPRSPLFHLIPGSRFFSFHACHTGKGKKEAAAGADLPPPIHDEGEEEFSLDEFEM